MYRCTIASLLLAAFVSGITFSGQAQQIPSTTANYRAAARFSPKHLVLDSGRASRLTAIR